MGFLKTVPLADGQRSEWVGHDANNGDLNNYGSISMNDFGSNSAATYDWHIWSMKNKGSIQRCGHGDTDGSPTKCTVIILVPMVPLSVSSNVTTTSVVHPSGVIPPSHPPGVATNVQNIVDSGVFRIINAAYYNIQNVYGTGCWVIGKDVTLYLEDGSDHFQNNSYGPTFANQATTFSDGTGTLHMEVQVYSHNPNFGPRVYNYGP